jgi:hypothetical protein
VMLCTHRRRSLSAAQSGIRVNFTETAWDPGLHMYYYALLVNYCYRRYRTCHHEHQEINRTVSHHPS